jgi:Bardet-Biedl syndrome 5 protein
MSLQKSLRVRESKFGRALVLETFAKAGGYILGFRVDPQDRINEVYQEIHSLYQIYSVAPMFGVDFTLEAEAPNLEQLLQPKVNEDTELIDDHEDTHAIAVSARLPSISVYSYDLIAGNYGIALYFNDVCTTAR